MSEKEKSELDRRQKDLHLETEIKKRPWENHPKSIGQIYQCYCSELNKLMYEEKDAVKLNQTGLSDGKPLRYQDGIKIKLNVNDQNESERHYLKGFQLNKTPLSNQFLKTFQIQSQFPLSLTARHLLLSFTNKYIYYAIDDILYMSSISSSEREHLLDIIYSLMLSLQNDFSTNFFDIWIDSVYLNTNPITNRFLQNQTKSFDQISETTITLKLHYFIRTPVKKPESIW